MSTMIKIRIRNDDHEIDLQFPISENKLYAKLAEIHAIEGKDAPQSAFVTEVYWPEELSMLKDRFANLDELNYLARRMESFDYHEYDQFLIGITKLENPTEKDLITVTRSGNQYTFTSKNMISNAVMISAQKKTNLGMGKMLIWGCPGKQTMASGAEDPVFFYFKLNTETKGVGHIVKTSEDGKVEGIKFTITGNGINETVTTGKNGTVDLDLLPGTYKVTNKSFDNVLKKWNLTVTKQDVETGSAQGDANLAGAKYGIYKGDELIDTYVTDADGKFTTKYYVCGTDWSIKELDSSEGYLVTPGNEQIGVDPKNYTAEYNSEAMKQYEQVKKGNIAIIKHTDDGQTQIETPEEGAEFAVYLKSAGSYDNAKDSERDYLVCDENGFAQTKDLPYGRYTVQQIKGWEGRELLMTTPILLKDYVPR